MLWAKEVQVQAPSCRVCFFFSLKGLLLIAWVFLTVPSQTLSVFWESFLHLKTLILSQPRLTNLTQRISLSSLSLPTHRHFLAGKVQKSWHWTLWLTWCSQTEDKELGKGQILGLEGCSRKTWKWGHNISPKGVVQTQGWT